MKKLFLWAVLALASSGLIAPTPAYCQPNLTKAPIKWPSIKAGADASSFDAYVGAIQYLLRARGLYRGRIDGIYGPKTVAAVNAFQRKNGLRADGVAGPRTLPKLIIPVKRGSKGDAVRAAQVLAREATGHDGETPSGGLEVDGNYGHETERAVKIAQECQNDFERELVVDGVMGPRSWCILLGGTVVGSQV